MQSEIILFRTAPTRRDEAAAGADRQIKPRPRLTDPIFPPSATSPAEQESGKPQRG
jgi:hypothetical protein